MGATPREPRTPVKMIPERIRDSVAERDHMRPFALTTLVAAALGLSGVMFAWHPVLADSVEPVPLEAGRGDPVCRSDHIVDAPKPSAKSEGRCSEHANEPDETARARAYLIETATPGYTMTRQGPELAIGRLHPEFVKRLAAAIAEARGAGLLFAGIFSAYRPPVFGVGGFADKFHSLHTYGLAVDVIGIGAPGTPSALLWQEIAARNGVICPYGPHNLLEWNHCQPTWVKIILADNPLRETVTADGPISLEDMFEVGYSLIAASGTIGTSTGDPPAHFFKPLQARPAMAIDTKIANNRITPKTTLSALDGYTMRWPPLSGGRVGWPKGVPRIAMLDETRRSDSRAANRRFSHPSLISIPLMPNKEVPNKSTSTWAVQLVGGLSEAKALAAYRALQKKHEAILGNYQPTVIRTTTVKKSAAPIWTRIRIEAQTRQIAETLCSRLRAASETCLIQRN
jgi:hypothetical protein